MQNINEQKAVREDVAMIDYSMLGKLMVEGVDSEIFLQRLCTNDIALDVGSVAYTLMLNDRGGIESDVTVACHGSNRFMVMSSISHTRRTQLHLQKHIKPNENVRLRDVTTAYAVLSLAGPKAREVLSLVSNIDVSNQAFRFNSLQEFYIGHAPVFAQRLSYTGELGWEIFITPDFAEYVFDTLLEAGGPFVLRLVGAEALNALRIEKGFLHWGHDMSYTEAPHQVGLDFICKPNKTVPFIGRDAYLAQKVESIGPFLCYVKLQSSEPLLHHNEPVLIDDKIVGYVASGAFAYAQNAAVGICFINLDDRALIESGSHSVIVEGKTIPASLCLKPFSLSQTSD